jgi:hypothetical protein
VQDLLTHPDAAMRKLYLAGHEQPWTEVSARGFGDRIATQIG